MGIFRRGGASVTFIVEAEEYGKYTVAEGTTWYQFVEANKNNYIFSGEWCFEIYNNVNGTICIHNDAGVVGGVIQLNGTDVKGTDVIISATYTIRSE